MFLMRSRYTDSSLTVTLYGIDPGYVVSTQTGDWETGEPFKKRTKVDESEPEARATSRPPELTAQRDRASHRPRPCGQRAS